MNKIVTVSQLNNYVKNVFEDELLLQNITVEGEVYEAKFSGGNTYLTLKEGDCVLPCVKFGSRFEFTVGDKIRVTGSVRFYPRGGKITFVIIYASACGKGDLLVKLNELKEKLSKEGVFNNTKSLPPFIRKIALVTSVDGAVIHDFLEVLSRNGCGYIDIDVYGVKVQGLNADGTIAKAIQSAKGKFYDVMVVARGGGSEQDLNCFNTESVARSVFECEYPVISAIGHEVDYTLCDLASSLRAGTPSIAAEYVVRNNEAFLARFYKCLDAMRAKAESVISCSAIKAKRISSDLVLSCAAKAHQLRSRLIACTDRMHRSIENKLALLDNDMRNNLVRLSSGAQSRLDLTERELRFTSTVLDKTSPLKILSDGYAKVIKHGKSVDSALNVNIGDDLKVIMSGGTLDVTVTDKE